MGKYVAMLEYLMQIKKTKDPNNIERSQFKQAWLSMVHEEGYFAAESYLYDGFTYCGAAPLRDYIKSSDDSLARLNDVFKGKSYGKNSTITASILFHLLSLFINEKKPNYEIINTLIKNIPSALINKEGKLDGWAERTLKKYVLDILCCDKITPFNELMNKGLNVNDAKEFISLLKQIVNGVDSEKYSKKRLKNLNLIMEWLKFEFEVMDKCETNIEESDNEVVAVNNEKKLADTEADRVRAEFFAVQAELDKANQRNELQSKTIQNLQIKIADLNNAIGEKNAKIHELTDKCNAKMHKVEELEETLAQKERELSEKSQMTEALSKDRAKQSDEAINRLAAKLRVEYRDFMDAADLPMDNDLGENMREQLKNVFDILIKSGVSINN